MLDKFIPSLLMVFLEGFRGAFNSPGYLYFKSFIWALMVIPGRKRVTDIANACFFLKKHVSSFGITIIVGIRREIKDVWLISARRGYDVCEQK